jgi:hypothetical protein
MERAKRLSNTTNMRKRCTNGPKLTLSVSVRDMVAPFVVQGSRTHGPE